MFMRYHGIDEIRFEEPLPSEPDAVTFVIKAGFKDKKIPVKGIKTVLIDDTIFCAVILSDVTGNHLEHWVINRGIPKLKRVAITPVGCKLKPSTSIANAIGAMAREFKK